MGPQQTASSARTLKFVGLRLFTTENVGSHFLSLRNTTQDSRQLRSTTGELHPLFLSPNQNARRDIRI